MNNSSVIHLVNNAPEHPENTAAQFKVSYNLPFDLTGKKIALIDASFTKAQNNVLGEKITVKSYSDPIKFVKNLTYASTDTWTDETVFFKRFNTTVMNEGRELAKVTYEFTEATRLLTINIKNSRGGIVYVTVRATVRSAASNYWFIKTARGFSGLTNISATRTRYILQPGLTGHLTLKIKPLDSLVGERRDFAKMKRKMMFKIGWQAKKYPPLIIQPGPGYFNSVNELINVINSKLNGQLKIKVAFHKISISRPEGSRVKTLDLGGLQNHLGFTSRVLEFGVSRPSKYIADHPPDMTRGTHHFYIYCSLVKETALNNKMLQILATVDATRGRYGEKVVYPIAHPLFVEAIEGQQQVVEVTIADGTGTSTGLITGETKLTLAVQDYK